MNVDTPDTALRGEWRTDEPLAPWTSWRIGGPAERLYLPADTDDLTALLASLPADEPVFWLGLGSNLLIRDGGIRGTVIVTRYALGGLEHDGGGRVVAGAGVACARLARFCVDHDLVGGEFFIGIPGTVGGALTMNAGAWGGATWEQVEAVETVDRAGVQRTRPAADFRYGYRVVEGPEGEFFTRAHLRFRQGDGAAARQRMRRMLAERSESQPTSAKSCGSVFRNPPGDHAARLIEAAGLKGAGIGGARVSERHANFIVNDGRATAADVEALIGRVRAAVERTTGIRLETEVRIVGETA